jgi:hypothetical protein
VLISLRQPRTSSCLPSLSSGKLSLFSLPPVLFDSPINFRSNFIYLYSTWVHNNAGPDCTLMSKVFKVVPKSHKNDDGTDSIEDDGSSLDPNVDNGCFGVSVDKPSSGEKVKAGEAYTVSLSKGTLSHGF